MTIHTPPADDAATPGFPPLSYEQLAGIINIAEDAIIAIDAQQRMILFNQGAEHIFGYTAGEALGQPLDLLLPGRFAALHRRYVVAFGASSTITRRMGERTDIYGLRKDGSEFPAEASISKLDLQGKLTFLVILRDITARQQAEQMLLEKHAELERAIQTKDRFLATMSHELRTPLNAIIGFTGTLLMRLPGPLTADQEKQLTTVQRSARHLLSLINDLLDLAKIESGRVDLRLEPVNCREVIEEVANNLRPLAAAKNLQLTTILPEEHVVLQTDRRALSQIVINLTNNAIKFTSAGTVTLEMVQRGEAPAGRWMELRVSDTGIGIQPGEQQRLFGAFERGKGSHNIEGTGLGLHLSQKLAELLGGSIEVTSIYGQGSTFTLLLPGD
jgi:protein-histidine pros-kinase